MICEKEFFKYTDVMKAEDKMINEQLEMFQPEPVSVDDVLAERGKRYGTFKGHAEIAQHLKNISSAYLIDRDKQLSSMQQEAFDMIFHKMARIINGDNNYADSWVDIAGYAKLVADSLQGNDK